VFIRHDTFIPVRAFVGSVDISNLFNARSWIIKKKRKKERSEWWCIKFSEVRILALLCIDRNHGQ
jgi:hypothetical protein